MRKRKQRVVRVSVIYAAAPDCRERLKKVLALLLRPPIGGEALPKTNGNKDPEEYEEAPPGPKLGVAKGK